MNGDAALLAMPQAEFEQWTGEALKLCRGGDVLSLSTLPLAHSALVEPCFLTGEPISTDVRGRAVQAVLRWAVDRLRPAGEHSWTAVAWRMHNLLKALFIDGRRVSEVAESMGLSEQTLYQLRPQAVAAAARVLRAELEEPVDPAGRRDASLMERYARLSPGEQQVLRLAAIFRRPVPASLIHRLAQEAGARGIQDSLRGLVAARLLVSDEQGSDVLARPEIRQYLAPLLTPQERRQWHYAAGEHAQGRGAHLDAARHFLAAGAQESAAQTLIAHWRDIADDAQLEDLRDVLAGFRAGEVSAEAWPRLKIIAGEVAESLDDVDTALAEYQKALGAADVHTKALAYYRRAKALELKDIDESLAHYGYGIQLLGEAAPRDPLLSRMHIDQAWIFIQERQDLARAEASLNRAQLAIAAADRESWADLHNAWGELCYRKGDAEAAIDHHWQGWLAAKEIDNAERQMKAAHNLGQLYAETGKYDRGLVYLQEAKDLAMKIGNRKLEALCDKSIGACHFWLGQVPEAIRYYRVARDIFVEMKNQSWQAHACYDLAEAHAEMGDLALGAPFYDEGRRIAQAIGSERLLREFDDLARRHAGLGAAGRNLGERHLKALAWARAQGSVTNRDYQRLTGISQKQAARDLAELAAKGLLVRLGGGRSTRYELPAGKTDPPASSAGGSAGGNGRADRGAAA